MSKGRTVVSDTGPLISLEKLTDGFGFIRLLYDTILISPAVLKELEEGLFNEGISYLDHYGISDLIEIVEMDLELSLPGTADLDEGEREAIQLAYARQLPILIEEEAGRRVAWDLGLQISGIAGQVVKAFRNERINAEKADSAFA